MPLIRIQPNILLNPENGLEVIYDARAGKVQVCPPGAAVPIEYRAPACDPAAIFAALLARVPPAPDAARAMTTGLEDLVARLSRLERAVGRPTPDADSLGQQVSHYGDALEILVARMAKLERVVERLTPDAPGGDEFDALARRGTAPPESDDPAEPDGSKDRTDIAGPTAAAASGDDEPLPCRCGADAEMMYSFDKETGVRLWWAQCTECAFGGRDSTWPSRASAVAAWNRRMAADDEPDGSKDAADIAGPECDPMIDTPTLACPNCGAAMVLLQSPVTRRDPHWRCLACGNAERVAETPPGAGPTLSPSEEAELRRLYGEMTSDVAEALTAAVAPFVKATDRIPDGLADDLAWGCRVLTVGDWRRLKDAAWGIRTEEATTSTNPDDARSLLARSLLARSPRGRVVRVPAIGQLVEVNARPPNAPAWRSPGEVAKVSIADDGVLIRVAEDDDGSYTYRPDDVRPIGLAPKWIAIELPAEDAARPEPAAPAKTAGGVVLPSEDDARTAADDARVDCPWRDEPIRSGDPAIAKGVGPGESCPHCGGESWEELHGGTVRLCVDCREPSRANLWMADDEHRGATAGEVS